MNTRGGYESPESAGSGWSGLVRLYTVAVIQVFGVGATYVLEN